MRGTYEVCIENAYIKYEFVIRRNITVIRGESATGKTTLFEMVRAYSEEEESGISVRSKKQLVAVYGKDWERKIRDTKDSIIFIDEQSRFVKLKDFAELLRESDNYYVIITREKLSELPYSVSEIYGIRTRGKYAGLTGEYTANEFYRIYGVHPERAFRPDVIITEDSNSGYDFWKSISRDCKCISADGKSKVLGCLKGQGSDLKKYLAVVDGAAFGAEIEEIIQYIKYNNSNVEIYAPESFEYLLLCSDLFKSNEINSKCRDKAEYADSTIYMSWEQFYTALLVEITKDTEMQYSKKELNMYYLSERNLRIIMQEIPRTLLVGEK